MKTLQGFFDNEWLRVIVYAPDFMNVRQGANIQYSCAIGSTCNGQVNNKMKQVIDGNRENLYNPIMTQEFFYVPQYKLC